MSSCSKLFTCLHGWALTPGLMTIIQRRSLFLMGNSKAWKCSVIKHVSKNSKPQWQVPHLEKYRNCSAHICTISDKAGQTLTVPDVLCWHGRDITWSVRASRGEDGELYLSSNNEIFPWCFAYDNFNYSRYHLHICMKYHIYQRNTWTPWIL